MATVDLSIKLTELPATKNLKTGHFVFTLSVNGLKYALKFKPSAWNKALSQIDEIESSGGFWQATIKGAAGKFNAGTVIVDGAGIHIVKKNAPI